MSVKLAKIMNSINAIGDYPPYTVGDFYPFDSLKWTTTTDKLKIYDPVVNIVVSYDEALAHITVTLPGFDKTNIKTLTYDKKTHIVRGEVYSNENDVGSSLSFATTITEDVEPESFKIVSFEKGILKLSAKRHKAKSTIINIT